MLAAMSDEPTVTAALRHDRSADEQPRTGNKPLFRRGSVVSHGPADIAHRGEAAGEHAYDERDLTLGPPLTTHVVLSAVSTSDEGRSPCA